MTRYQMNIEADSLPRVWFSAPSTYAVVKVTDGPQKGTTLGQTEVANQSRSPDWIALLFVDTDSATYMPISVEIYHRREFNDDVLLGEASFEVTEVHTAPGHRQSHSLSRGGGTVCLSVHESQKGDALGLLELEMRGLDIKNVEPGLVGLGRSDPFFEISKKDADHSAGVVQWNIVYRSKHIVDHLNPYWERFHLDLEVLCYNDLSWPIRVTVKDWQRNGKHRVIGQFETTVETLIDRVAVKGNADREKAFEIYKESLGAAAVSQGLVCVLRANHVAS